ncbi:hypothetical protein QYE76_063290, partial [Lolium multiflorum]
GSDGSNLGQRSVDQPAAQRGAATKPAIKGAQRRLDVEGGGTGAPLSEEKHPPEQTAQGKTDLAVKRQEPTDPHQRTGINTPPHYRGSDGSNLGQRSVDQPAAQRGAATKPAIKGAQRRLDVEGGGTGAPLSEEKHPPEQTAQGKTDLAVKRQEPTDPH